MSDSNIENNKVEMKLSPSFYEKINSKLQNSPGTVITSICALFIVIILSLTLPLYFPPINKNSNE